MLSYEISDYCDPVKPVRKGRSRSEFRQKIEGLPVGKAVIVTGMSQSDLCSRASAIGRQMEPKRKFSTASLGDGRFQIARIS